MQAQLPIWLKAGLAASCAGGSAGAAADALASAYSAYRGDDDSLLFLSPAGAASATVQLGAKRGAVSAPALQLHYAAVPVVTALVQTMPGAPFILLGSGLGSGPAAVIGAVLIHEK